MKFYIEPFGKSNSIMVNGNAQTLCKYNFEMIHIHTVIVHVSKGFQF